MYGAAWDVVAARNAALAAGDRGQGCAPTASRHDPRAPDHTHMPSHVAPPRPAGSSPATATTSAASPTPRCPSPWPPSSARTSGLPRCTAAAAWRSTSSSGPSTRRSCRRRRSSKRRRRRPLGAWHRQAGRSSCGRRRPLSHWHSQRRRNSSSSSCRCWGRQGRPPMAGPPFLPTALPTHRHFHPWAMHCGGLHVRAPRLLQRVGGQKLPSVPAPCGGWAGVALGPAALLPTRAGRGLRWAGVSHRRATRGQAAWPGAMACRCAAAQGLCQLRGHSRRARLGSKSCFRGVLQWRAPPSVAALVCVYHVCSFVCFLCRERNFCSRSPACIFSLALNNLELARSDFGC